MLKLSNQPLKKNFMNKLKLLPFVVLLMPLGCSEDTGAMIDVMKDRISNRITDMVGRGDVALKKYDNKLIDVKNKLIRVTVSGKTFEQKLQARKASLATLEQSGGSKARISLLKSTVQDMEVFLQQIQAAKTKLAETLIKLKENRELVALKISALQAKRDMLDAMRTMQQYTNIETKIDAEGFDNTIDEMQKEIHTIEAELEVEQLLAQANNLSGAK
jgi:hypothetical protein